MDSTEKNTKKIEKTVESSDHNVNHSDTETTSNQSLALVARRPPKGKVGKKVSVITVSIYFKYIFLEFFRYQVIIIFIKLFNHVLIASISIID